MFYIHCPYCAEQRSEEEFHCMGQAHIQRPENPEAASDREWGDYLFFRDNLRGLHQEMWVHAAGCRKFFNVARNTVSYEILETYRMGAQPSVTASTAAHGRDGQAEQLEQAEQVDKVQRVRT